MIEKKRNLNLDLIRCIAILCVPVMHFIDNSGFYTIEMDGMDDYLMALVRSFFATSVTLYVMLSGYLCNKKPLSLRYYLGILRVLELYLLCSAACLLFEHLYLGEQYTLRKIIGLIVNWEACGYGWYVLVYVGLFPLMPFLNMMYHGCANQRQKLILVITFFAMSILPSLANSYVHIYSLWWDRLWPICYYFTGAYISEFGQHKSAKKYGIALIVTLLAFTVYNQFYFAGDAGRYDGIHNDHYQMFVLGVLIFLFVLNLDTQRCPKLLEKFINRVSELSFSIYLLTWISDGILYRTVIPNYPVISDRYKMMFIWVPISFFSGMFMAQIVHWIYAPIDRFIRSKLLRLLGE